MTPDTARAQMSSLSALTPAFLLNKFVWKVFQLWLWNLMVCKNYEFTPKILKQACGRRIFSHYRVASMLMINKETKHLQQLFSFGFFAHYWAELPERLKQYSPLENICGSSLIHSEGLQEKNQTVHKNNTPITKIMHRKTVPHVQTKCGHLHYLKLLRIITFCVFCDFNIYICWSKASVILLLWRAVTHVNDCIPHCVLICCYFFYSIIFVRSFCWKQKHVK